jgi:hypothetical protein
VTPFSGDRQTRREGSSTATALPARAAGQIRAGTTASVGSPAGSSSGVAPRPLLQPGRFTEPSSSTRRQRSPRVTVRARSAAVRTASLLPVERSTRRRAALARSTS